MATKDLSAQSTADLESALRKLTALTRTVSIIFGVIVLVWVLGGYWRQNVPVFISTVALSVAITAMQYTSMSAVRAELARRAGRGGA
ncbi:MAG: hypothetical protein IT357_02900 [Gemmatimonadaceae bacterium]|nr:hypothetical protein [Gemmatimonadaceae bacterium]